jgi:hypothetical protein
MVSKPRFALQPNHVENSVALKDSPVRPQKIIDLWLQLFSVILDDEKLTKELQNMLKGTLDIEESPKEMIIDNILERNTSRIQRRKRRSRREFRLNTHIDNYEIINVMLDLGSDVNILPKKTWESMGKPKLVYSPIQL